MRCTMLGMVLMCLPLATGAEARGAWGGAQLAFPIPARDVGDIPLGIDLGMTMTDMLSTHVGVGADLFYHYWPASPQYQAAFDQYLATYRAQVIDSPSWAFRAFQLTVHLKLAAPIGQRFSMWVQGGGGLYQLNRNISEPNWEGSYVLYVGKVDNTSLVYGGNASIGFDARTGPGTVIGLNASYHNVAPEYHTIPHYTVFTLGTHVLFGW